MSYTLKKNRFGYYSIVPLPSKEDLESYYSKQYYQDNNVSTYKEKYSDIEIDVLRIDSHVSDHIFMQNEKNPKSSSLLDIACGEGFFMKGMKDIGWKIYGTDYSKAGLERFNPDLLENVMIGDLEYCLKHYESNNITFDFINLGNILEHVVDPIDLLQKCKVLLAKSGVLRVKVPNDFSELQLSLVDNNLANENWICPPDHLSYFNFDSLEKLLIHLGFNIKNVLGDFPIEFFLANKNSNYHYSNVGEEAHHARIYLTNLIWNQGIKRFIEWSSGLAAAKVSRSCIFYVTK